MIDRLRSCSRAGLTLALGWTLVGCGATGLDWVDQPESASGWSGTEPRGLTSSPVSAPAGSIPAAQDSELAPENHQRLNHTITLGEVDATPLSEQAASPYGPAVSVTINNYGPSAAGPSYAGYYSGYTGFAGRSFARSGNVTATSRPSSSLQPGQNWPAIADHGTSFPYRSAPASAWAGADAGPRR